MYTPIIEQRETEMSIRIETDCAIDQNDPERFSVVKRTEQHIRVLFEGTYEACEDYIHELKSTF